MRAFVKLIDWIIFDILKKKEINNDELSILKINIIIFG
jgi:hypothetical protein